MLSPPESRGPHATVNPAPSIQLIIGASTIGSLFEWYDFFLYGTLAAQLGARFFPSSSSTAGLLAALATFGAGFVVRPAGGAMFGMLGDRIGRKRTFLITIVLMGTATVGIGLVPTYDSIGVWATVALVALRMLQGMALGGEFSGAAIYLAEHAPPGRRGFYTGWIQSSGMAGFLLCLAVVAGCQRLLGEERFEAWGWRLPFLLSAVLIAISIAMRLKLDESPVFSDMQRRNRGSKHPFREALSTPGNPGLIAIGIVGVTAGMSVIFYTTQFSTLYFLQGPAGLDGMTAKLLLGAANLLGIPMVIAFGALSDRTGRKAMLVTSYVLTLLLLAPVFHYMTNAANPALAATMSTAPVTVSGSDCRFDAFATRQTTPCGQARGYLNGRNVGYERLEASTQDDVVVMIGERRIVGVDTAAWDAALAAAGYGRKADPALIDRTGVIAAAIVLIFLNALSYAHAAALLSEIFPARIRYTSMSLSHNIGSAYFGGMQPLVASYIIAVTGNLFGGLWYCLAVVAVALLVCVLFLRESKDRLIGE